MNNLMGQTLDHKETEQLKDFLVSSTDYYLQQFERISQGQKYSLNLAAFVFGPLWAASRNIWMLFWLLAATDIAALVIIGQSLWGGETHPESSFGTGCRHTGFLSWYRRHYR